MGGSKPPRVLLAARPHHVQESKQIARQPLTGAAVAGYKRTLRPPSTPIRAFMPQTDVPNSLPPDLEQRLRSKRFVLTAELVPPVSCDANDLLSKAMPLAGLADAVNITDGAGARAHMSALAAASILVKAGIDPILQLTCRDRNRIALQSDLMGASALGVRNLLLLSGDPPSAGDQVEAKPVFDLDARALTQIARRMRDQSELPTGQKVGGKAEFFLGAADAPIDPPAGWKPDSLQAKRAAGAQFVQTQFCMDVGIVRRYTARLAEAGLGDLFLLIGVNPLRSAKSAHWMRNHLFGTIIPDALVTRMEKASDPVAEGVMICVELIEVLSAIDGVAGVHIMAPGNDVAIPAVIKEVRRRTTR
jgi:methylenetetrahydrofolate reductase (NADPH)